MTEYTDNTNEPNTDKENNTMSTIPNNWTADELAVYNQGICPHNQENTPERNYDCGKCDDLTMKIHEDINNNKENNMNPIQYHLTHHTELDLTCKYCQEAAVRVSSEDESDLVELAKEDYDKENNMKCVCITKKGEKCQGKKIDIIGLLVKGGDAVHEDLYKANNMVGYFRRELPICTAHQKFLGQGKVANVFIPRQMKLEESVQIEVPVEEVIPVPVKEEKLEKLLIPGAKRQSRVHILENGWVTEWHSTPEYALAHVAALRGHYEVKANPKRANNRHGYWVSWIAFPVVKKDERTKKNLVPVPNNGIACGACKDHHSSAAEVRACYANKRA